MPELGQREQTQDPLGSSAGAGLRGFESHSPHIAATRKFSSSGFCLDEEPLGESLL